MAYTPPSGYTWPQKSPLTANEMAQVRAAITGFDVESTPAIATIADDVDTANGDIDDLDGRVTLLEAEVFPEEE